MAKGKPASKIAKGAKGRKNHGPKRHLDHDIFPKAMRMEMGKAGLLSKYSSYDDFCVSMQARGVRADYKLLWAEFRALPVMDKKGNLLPNAREIQNNFFKNAKQIGMDAMKKQKKESKI